MPYQLRDNLSFCQVEDHCVFLDIRTDRYFLLSDALERTFMAYIDSSEWSATDVSELIKNNILIETPVTERSIVPSIPCPSHSALENGPATSKFYLSTFLEVCAIVSATKWQLKTRSLKDIVDRLIVCRRDRIKVSDLGMAESTEQRLLNAARLFQYVRPYVPIEMSCLLDSLSLIKFLLRRRLPATLIFGVTLTPFLAHCWVQVEGLVLNNLIGETSSYTPIKVI